MSAREAFLTLKTRIDARARELGRDPAGVKILAVSKLQPVEKIQELAREGQMDFGENYVQELLLKQGAVSDPSIRWHLIGHLQKNKVKLVVGRCHLIHSVDSLELAQLVSRKAGESGTTQRILLQVNTGGETTKEGFDGPAFLSALPSIAALPNLELHGLMTMPPFENEAASNRAFFAGLRDLLQKTRPQIGSHPWNQLSMGTSHDWETALEEGATILRLGTVLFGSRK